MDFDASGRWKLELPKPCYPCSDLTRGNLSVWSGFYFVLPNIAHFWAATPIATWLFYLGSKPPEPSKVWLTESNLRCLWCFLRCWLDQFKFASPQVPSQDNAQLGIWNSKSPWHSAPLNQTTRQWQFFAMTVSVSQLEPEHAALLQPQ